MSQLVSKEDIQLVSEEEAIKNVGSLFIFEPVISRGDVEETSNMRRLCQITSTLGHTDDKRRREGQKVPLTVMEGVCIDKLL